MKHKLGIMAVGLLSSFAVLATSVEVKTNLGDITIQLDEQNAPISSANFLQYVNNNSYSDTIFHRVIPGFMVQGGGFNVDLKQQPAQAPIKNESTNGLSNQRGTIAMARTQVVDSATRQFFINVVDNTFLDGSAAKPGYAVFGRVTSGMAVIDAIAASPTQRKQRMSDVPVEPIIIHSIRVLDE
ncbi:peptidylprolyl isomerase [Thaumasiovibrio sp. DFM-14]|uniref:peptidylprolyl isomerase n=1 Tax=Thaumasiovibrio sp. DFM-14 TaxID=3384792 RepID=UPI0039A089DF